MRLKTVGSKWKTVCHNDKNTHFYTDKIYAKEKVFYYTDVAKGFVPTFSHTRFICIRYKSCAEIRWYKNEGGYIMRNSGRRITAAMLSVLMIASSALSNVTTVQAQESGAVEITADQTVEVSTETNTADTEDVENISEEAATEESTQNASEEESQEETTMTSTSYEEKESQEETTTVSEDKVCAVVTASVKAGEVKKGTKVALYTATEGAAIMYNTNGTQNYTVYTDEIEITEDTTIYAMAIMDNFEDSEVVSFEYTIENTLTEKNIRISESDTDPISDEFIASIEGAINVKEAAALTSGTATVVGQVVYAYASKAGGDLINIVLEDVIDGEIYGYLVYDYSNYSKYNVGDIVAVTGTTTIYSNVPELKDITKLDILGTENAIEAQEITISELGADYLSEYVYIKDVTLGEYKSTGNISVADETGSINLYNAAVYPENVSAGSVADLYAACSAYGQNYQLRNGKSSDYRVKGTSDSTAYEIDESISLNVASFAGSGNFEGTTVYADLYAENDYQDKNTKLFLSNGNQPLISNTSSATGGTTYSIGSTGLMEGQYYQIETSSAKYGNMELSFFTKGSKTGPKNFVLEYSTDGENFKPAGKTTLACNYTAYTDGVASPVEVYKEFENGTFSMQTASKLHEIHIALPAEANNAKKLTLRLRVADSTSIKGATIGTGGTNYFNDIKLTANPLIADDFCNYVTASPKAQEVPKGQEITLSTDTKGAVIYYAFDDNTEYSVYDDSQKPVINKLPCSLRVYAAKEGIDDSIVITYQYSQAKAAAVKASPNGGAVALNSKVKLTCETEEAQILYAFADKQEIADDESEQEYDWKTYTEPITLKELPCTILVKAVKEGFEDSAVKTLSFTARENEKYNIYFGQLHSHTSYSDGAGTCEEAFQYATNVENLDFLAVTDHSNSFDNAADANINDGSMSTEWIEGHELALKYTTDEFVGLFGYEMTWSNGLGHMNTYNTNGFQSRTQAAYSTYSTALQNYYTALQTAPDSISQFNHPGTTFGDFSDFAYYSEANDALITTIEVGNGEGAIGSSGYFPSYEYYTRALDKGWHVAPTNNQDNHKGKWGSANTARSVVLADSLTQENIYDAMRNYRVYATEDNDLSIYYTLDSYIMGTCLDKDMVGDTVKLNVELADPTDAKLGKVEVIVNGGLSIASKVIDTSCETVTFEVPSDYSYYYIKVTQADGDIAVTAPVWVGEVEAAGINSLSTDEPLPIAGESLDVTLDLYNNEKSDLNLTSVEFWADDKLVNSVDLENAGFTKVDSESTQSYTFSYTYDKAGSVEIKAVVKAELNGAEKIYNEVLKLTFVDNSMVSHVVIDGTHYNDYVTGYYGGNVGSFIEIAADKNIKATVIKDEITAKDLAEASILIVSAPAKKSGTANAGDYVISHYEDEFIELVKEYVENGGTVIVCGIADYQDTTDGQTATETNKLLEAIGSTIRMNSDEAYDEENNGGQPYRLYYQTVNKDSEHLAGFREGQTYSAYSGCTVDITNALEETSKVYPATWLVKGFDTTYSVDCKTDSGEKSDNSVYVSKGDVVALASQKTKFGGEIFVAGSVFMSDFEVEAEIDNNDSLPYANYTIINNILESKKIEIQATDIAEVRKAELGDVFAIEGYVANGTENENNTFFDTIYVQDATGGITVFPFAEAGLKAGSKIRVVGYVDAYQGDKELQLVSYEILDDVNLADIKVTELSVKDSMDYDVYGGSLIKVTGKVSRVELENGVVSEFWLTDEAGNEAAIFIDGYITSAVTGVNTIAEFVKPGNIVTAQGFLYKHPEGASDESVPVLRVRNCDEIILVEEATENPDSDSNSGGSNSGSSDESNSDENTSNASAQVNTAINNASTTVKAPYVSIPEASTALAQAVESFGLPCEDITANLDRNILRAALLDKYYGNNSMIIGHLGNAVGFTIAAAGLQQNNMDIDLSIEKRTIANFAQGFTTIQLISKNPQKLTFQIGIHTNVGAEYIGEAAYIFEKSLETGAYSLNKVMFVNEIGNVALTTNEVTDYMILIAD